MEDGTARRAHALTLLETEVDAWVATSSPDGPHLVPLSFAWHRELFLFATSATSPTGRNALGNGRARAGVGTTRDLVILVGDVRPVRAAEEHLLGAFTQKVGFGLADVGDDGTLFALAPRDIQAWVESAGPDRWVMRGGRWTP